MSTYALTQPWLPVSLPKTAVETFNGPDGQMGRDVVVRPGVAADPRYIAVADEPWGPGAGTGWWDSAIGEPWRLPGSLMIDAFDAPDLHHCRRVENAGVFLFVNPYDFLNPYDFVDPYSGPTPVPLWIVVHASYDRGVHTARAFARLDPAEEDFYQATIAAANGCDACC